MNQHNILGFNIPVNNFMFVHITDSLKNLPRQDGYRVFMQFVFLFHHVIKLPIASQFHEQVNIVIVGKIRIKFN
jgi:hypothetical protein